MQGHAVDILPVLSQTGLLLPEFPGLFSGLSGLWVTQRKQHLEFPHVRAGCMKFRHPQYKTAGQKSLHFVHLEGREKSSTWQLREVIEILTSSYRIKLYTQNYVNYKEKYIISCAFVIIQVRVVLVLEMTYSPTLDLRNLRPRNSWVKFCNLFSLLLLLGDSPKEGWPTSSIG